jgi:hypothetical protein
MYVGRSQWDRATWSIDHRYLVTDQVPVLAGGGRRELRWENCISGAQRRVDGQEDPSLCAFRMLSGHY